MSYISRSLFDSIPTYLDTVREEQSKYFHQDIEQIEKRNITLEGGTATSL